MFKDDLLKGKRILVTGGGTGLGRVMAEEYLKLGADVVIAGRRKSKLDEAAGEMMDAHGGNVVGISCDIKDAQAVDDMLEEIWHTGGLTGLVNNAAGNFIAQTHKLSPRAFNAIADIVMRGTFYVTNGVGRRWIENGDRGSVISILTTWVWNGSPFTVPSAMSKTAVAAMTKSLAQEWGPHGIRLNAIAPGAFPTKGAWERLMPSGGDEESRYENNPMRRHGEMPELANLATFLMADGIEYLTGEVIAIDGAGWLANGGNFSQLSHLTDEQWDQIREMIQGTNQKDKAERNG
ncbi:MAG: SDR family oxidoreductase [Alphaproteobacteria bacterium]|nr:SDR family oxidoreductase [Alphaproteobacteria bacterium]